MATPPDVATNTLPSEGPDWSSLPEEILCPLCNYNLRGLIEPRCPECGYRFAWPDLLDSSRRLHPYLFEHHPERNIWSWYKTATGLLRPGRFWRSLSPAQPSRPRRLVAYWAVGVVAVLPLLAIYTPAAVWSTATVNANRIPVLRASHMAYLNRPQEAKAKKLVVDKYGSTQAYLNAEYPLARDYSRAIAEVGLMLRQTSPFLVAVIIWPWVTSLCLLIFQASMRRTKIRAVHVFRTVLYNQDIMFFILVTICAFLEAPAPWRFGVLRTPIAALTTVIVSLIVESVFVYRMTVAYKHYLQFDRPLATVLASQIVTGLVVLNLLMIPLVWR